MTSNNPTPVLGKDDSAVRAVLNDVVAAWADNDPDAFAALYAENATVVLPGGVYHKGRDEIRTYMAAAFAGPMKGSKSIDEQQNVRILGDAAVVISLSGFVMPGATGVPAERLRRATWVLSKRNEKWSVESYHNCSVNAA
jgi:uncharacterized protein (TIGR02246 family)